MKIGQGHDSTHERAQNLSITAPGRKSHDLPTSINPYCGYFGMGFRGVRHRSGPIWALFGAQGRADGQEEEQSAPLPELQCMKAIGWEA